MKDSELTDLERFVIAKALQIGMALPRIAELLNFESILNFFTAVRRCNENLDKPLLRSLSIQLKTPEAFLIALTLKKYELYESEEDELFDTLRTIILDHYSDLNNCLNESATFCDKHFTIKNFDKLEFCN